MEKRGEIDPNHHVSVHRGAEPRGDCNRRRADASGLEAGSLLSPDRQSELPRRSG
jgi:hypothetical protein